MRRIVPALHVIRIYTDTKETCLLLEVLMSSRQASPQDGNAHPKDDELLESMITIVSLSSKEQLEQVFNTCLRASPCVRQQ